MRTDERRLCDTLYRLLHHSTTRSTPKTRAKPQINLEVPTSGSKTPPSARSSVLSSLPPVHVCTLPPSPSPSDSPSASPPSVPRLPSGSILSALLVFRLARPASTPSAPARQKLLLGKGAVARAAPVDDLFIELARPRGFALVARFPSAGTVPFSNFSPDKTSETHMIVAHGLGNASTVGRAEEGRLAAGAICLAGL